MIQGTASELIVHLGSVDLNLEAVLALQEGDILHLPQAVDAPSRCASRAARCSLAEAGRIDRTGPSSWSGN